VLERITSGHAGVRFAWCSPFRIGFGRDWAGGGARRLGWADEGGAGPGALTPGRRPADPLQQLDAGGPPAQSATGVAAFRGTSSPARAQAARTLAPANLTYWLTGGSRL